MYAKNITLIINQFQALQYLITDITVDFVWQYKDLINITNEIKLSYIIMIIECEASAI